MKQENNKTLEKTKKLKSKRQIHFTSGIPTLKCNDLLQKGNIWFCAKTDLCTSLDIFRAGVTKLKRNIKASFFSG